MQDDEIMFPLCRHSTNLTQESLMNLVLDALARDARFEGRFDQLYRTMKHTPSWYTGPESSREMARSCAESLVDMAINGRVYMVKSERNIIMESGCLRLSFHIFGSRLLTNPEIRFSVMFTEHDDEIGKFPVL